ncbi:MAG: class I SAM-dependent methyltransferase [Nitrospirae bacterium]|nr:class I SAM-dependent methyltransferase [Nitrospirota bacterium]
MGTNIVDVFDLYAKQYDKWFETIEGKALFKTEVEAVRLIIKDLRKPFLEVGAGTGRFAKELGIEFGIDPSSEALEIAKQRGIKVRKAKGEDLPFKDETFGAVFILFTLCFVDNPLMVLAEAKRALKKDGGLIVGIINRESRPWGQLYIRKKAESHPIYRHASFFGINEVAEMIGKTGMAIEKYSSALCPLPSEKPYKEGVRNGLIEGSGFVCILARKLKC